MTDSSHPHPIRALVVDDEPAVRRFLKTSLSARGYAIEEAGSGSEALEVAQRFRPDIILLDLGLPDMSGVEVTRVLREWSNTPILILSVLEAEADKVAALDAGADDYLTKPFGMSELQARLRAHLRRSQQHPDEPTVRSAGLVLDLAARSVAVNGEAVSLTPTEYDILRVLARHAGRVLMHKQLMREVWGHSLQDLHTLRVNISNIRRKIELDPAHPRILITEPGVGYRFVIA